MASSYSRLALTCWWACSSLHVLDLLHLFLLPALLTYGYIRAIIYIYIYNKVLLFSPCSLNHPRFWTWNQGFSNLDNDPRSLRASITLISCDLDWFGHATSIIKLRVPSMTPLKWLGAASGVDLAPKADVPMICPSLLGYFTRGTSRSLEVWLIHTSMYHVSAARIVGTGVDAATSPTKEGYKPTVFASSLNKS